jgi:UDP-N-acetylmuramyl pentapeptide phosphotransferase/UDP-N-acetylglucosamine-1-phosphate transferase
MTGSGLLFNVGAIVAFWLAGRILLPFLFKVFTGLKWTAENYLHMEIPSRMGLLFLLPLLCFYYSQQERTVFFLFAAVLAAGWLDDHYGSHRWRGLKGHLKALVTEGVVTTGMLKVWLVGIASLYVAYRTADGWLDGLANFTALMLTVNFFNMLDLRPGRALKCFFLLTFPFVGVMPVFISGVIGMAAAIFEKDVKGKCMLGDTGSNFLGATAGVLLVYFLPPYLLWPLILFLAVVHIWSEVHSISEWIERQPLLGYLDRWGRI